MCKYLAKVIILYTFSCLVFANDCSEEINIMKWIESADPKKDAKLALQNGNKK